MLYIIPFPFFHRVIFHSLALLLQPINLFYIPDLLELLLNPTMWYPFFKFLLTIEALLSFVHGKSLMYLPGNPLSVPDSEAVWLIIRIKGSHGVLQAHSLDSECPPGLAKGDCWIYDSLVTQHIWVPSAEAQSWGQVGGMTTVTLTATVVTVIDTILDTTTTITETPLPTYTNSLGTRTQRITYTTDGSIVTTDL